VCSRLRLRTLVLRIRCCLCTACGDSDSMGSVKNPPREPSGVTTDYVYDLEGHAIAEVSGSGGLSRGEVFAGGKHIATYVNSTTYFSHADWLGTERVRSDMTGAPCESISSLPFGDGQSTSGSCGDPSTRHFTDKERDPESGLDNFGARYNSSSLGRFMSPDPKPDSSRAANPQSLNRYAYVLNNPLKYVDVLGECTSPALARGQVGICIESYIQAARLGHFPSKNWLGIGDNRGPVANDPKATFRSQTLVTVDLQKHTVSQQSQAGVSEILFKGYHPEPGTVVAGITHQSTDDEGNIHFGISVYALNGQAASGQTAAPQGWIEMHFEFQVDPNGTVVLTGGTSKTYPSVSVFSYSSDGSTNDLFEQRESGNPGDLNKPVQNIKRQALSDPIREDAQRQCALGNPAACM
jgi:RHS repeat-associated protein